MCRVGRVKILVDVSLTPAWIPYLREQGIESIHWSEIGDIRAPDSLVLQWAREHDCLVFTNDLDFAALHAATHAMGPSVLQLRTQDVLPSAIGAVVARVLIEHADALERGAILTIDVQRARVKYLPIERDE